MLLSNVKNLFLTGTHVCVPLEETSSCGTLLRGPSQSSNAVDSMSRRRKDCPIFGKRNLVKLSNHLADIHQLSAVERKYYLSRASDPKKTGDMSSSRKRMRSDSEDDMSTVARDEESEEEMSSPKRMRNESDDETSTVSNKDIFSSSDNDKSSEETDDASNGGESSEETDDSDEEADPWRALIDEATAELHTKHSELVQSFENDGFSEIDAKKQAFAAILPELRKELGNVYMDRLQWVSQLKRDLVHRKIMKTRDAFVADDEFDPDKALVAAVKKRKFLLERMLEDRQHFLEDDDDEDNACVPYGLKNELHYH